MDISKIETWSSTSNVYNDLRSVDPTTQSKVPTRSTSTIGYISPRQIDSPQIKRPTVSLILPVPTKTTSMEQMTTLDTILSIDNMKRSLSVESMEHEKNNLITNKDHVLISKENCVCWIIRETIQLLYIALFACFIAMFIFTLIVYAFDTYWFDKSAVNSSSWWFDYNDTNLTRYDYDMISATQTINYDEDY